MHALSLQQHTFERRLVHAAQQGSLCITGLPQVYHVHLVQHVHVRPKAPHKPCKLKY